MVRMKRTLIVVVSSLSRYFRIQYTIVMANSPTKESEVPLCAFITLLLTHCYSVFAILDRRVYVDDDLRRNYKLEDFLWSGSGDGENETEPSPTDEQIIWQPTTTVFHTTTVVSTSTVFYKTLIVTNSTESKVTQRCTNDPKCKIEPTPTIRLAPNSTITSHPPPTDYPYGDRVPDQRYWLITILKVNATAVNVVPFELEEHLAKLYKIAFHRHQENHLGLNGTWNKSILRSYNLYRRRRDHRDVVTVHIHNVSNDDALSVLYSVRVSGHPVLATTAAHDMKLVSDAEAVAELGYPILTKAEPYLKPLQLSNEETISHEKEYLLVLVSSVCAIVLLILLIILFILTAKKRKKKRILMEGKKGERKIFFKEGHDKSGVDNEAYSHENDKNKMENGHSLLIHKGDAETDAVSREFQGKNKNQCYLRTHRKLISPNSFLSMPSVKDFPTNPLPEPLTNLLNNRSPPVSDDKSENIQNFTRHRSMDGEDPGVLGPVVWHSHCRQLKKQDIIATDDDCSSLDSEVNIGQMRKRFNELLDDALSLYDSRHSLDDDVVSPSVSKQTSNHRSQSAALLKESENYSISSSAHLRPKTSLNPEQRKSITKNIPQPKDAWCSTPNTSARLRSRPLSAGPFHRPTICPEFIFTDARLSPNDPAVPVISAIKQELDKIAEYKSSAKELRHTKKRVFESSSCDV